MSEEKNKVGRPLAFKTVEELEKKIEEYFDSCYETVYDKETKKNKLVNIKPLTVSGLALYLDTDRVTLLRYEDYNNKEFCNTIRKAKQRIENFAEENLFHNPRTAGVIFNLKNNWNWVDKQEIVTSEKEIVVDIVED